MGDGSSLWEEIESGVWRLRDSCDVYAVLGPAGTVLVNAGTGTAAYHFGDLRARGAAEPFTVLLTHHLRDHSDGARRLHDAGAVVLANYGDRDFYLDPEQHFRERQTWNSYDNRWDRRGPVRPVPVSGWLRDYETHEIAGLTWEVVPTPGHTNGASSYVVTLPGGRRLAFTGETVCGPDGRTSRLASLQYDYNDLGGAVNLWHSAGRLLAARPDRLLPSRGEPMDDPAAALTALRANLRRIDEILPGFAASLPGSDAPEADDLEEILPGRLFRSRHSFANTHFVIGESGRVLALDYGYNQTGFRMPQRQHPSTRRALLHGLDGLRRRFGDGVRIDTVLITHFHDDHVAGIPVLRRLFGTEVWAGENFADVLERPERYDLPCLWYEPIPVARRLPCGASFTWDGVPVTLHPMSGHTRYATLICLEVGGVRVAHTGDQIFFQPWEFAPGAWQFTNHVYQNGLDLGCYRETVAHLERFAPDWILTGHTDPYQTSGAWWEAIRRGAEAFDDVHRALMPLGDDEAHFGAESQPAKLYPYRAHLPAGAATVTFDGWVMNPFPTPQEAVVCLVAPEGWETAPVRLTLGPRERKEFTIALTPPAGAVCRRQPVALDLTVGGRPFGQVTEALVSVGAPYF
jgi:glyoxylase-like metal-dependent hydrolase (beta-lactamase superfamily II)